jgi:hypothetical protein
MWAWILIELAERYRRSMARDSPVLYRLAGLTFDRLCESDLSGLPLQQLHNACVFFGYLDLDDDLGPRDWLVRARGFAVQLLERLLAVAFSKAIRDWIPSGDIASMADAYYRALRLFLVPGLPSDVIEWEACAAARWGHFKEKGLDLISTYRACDERLVWVAIHVLTVLETHAMRQEDLELREQLMRKWREVGVVSLESLIITGIENGDPRTVVVLKQQLKGIQAALRMRSYERSPALEATAIQ